MPGTPSPTRTRMSPELQAHVRRLYEESDQPVCQIALDVGVNESVIRRMGPREGWVRYVAPPRDLPPVAKLLAQVEELEEAVKAASLLSLPQASLPPTPNPSPPLATLAGGGEKEAAPLLSLPPRSGGEGRFDERQRDEAGWGEAGMQARTSQRDEEAPPTPDPSPPRASLVGGGEKDNIARFTQVVMAHLDELEAMRRDGKLLPKHHLETARAISILTEAFNRLARLRAALPGTIHDDLAATDRYAVLPADLDAFREELAQRIEKFLASRTDAGAFADAAAASAAAIE